MNFIHNFLLKTIKTSFISSRLGLKIQINVQQERLCVVSLFENDKNLETNAFVLIDTKLRAL